MSVDKTFIDTNVLLYALDSAAPLKREQAVVWLDYLWQHQSGRCSWQVLDEFYVNAVRKLKAPAPLARATVGAYQMWQPLGTSVAVTERAWYWMDVAQVTYWDGKILASAEQLGCRYLLSADFAHGRRYGEVEVRSPFAVSPPGL